MADVRGFNNFPSFPNFDKKIRLNREQTIQHAAQKLAPIPYWKLMKATQPVAPVDLDPELPPTLPPRVVDAPDIDPVNFLLPADLERKDYPKPPDEAFETVDQFSRPDFFREALHDQRIYRPYLVFGFVDDSVKADLTKFGKDRNHDGTLKLGRYMLEERALQVESGDLFLWRRQLMEVIERKEIDQMGVSSYWQNLEAKYISFRGDSSDLEIPDLDDLTGIIGVPESMITRTDGSKIAIGSLDDLSGVLEEAAKGSDSC